MFKFSPAATVTALTANVTVYEASSIKANGAMLAIVAGAVTYYLGAGPMDSSTLKTAITAKANAGTASAVAAAFTVVNNVCGFKKGIPVGVIFLQMGDHLATLAGDHTLAQMVAIVQEFLLSATGDDGYVGLAKAAQGSNGKGKKAVDPDSDPALIESAQAIKDLEKVQALITKAGLSAESLHALAAFVTRKAQRLDAAVAAEARALAESLASVANAKEDAAEDRALAAIA